MKGGAPRVGRVSERLEKKARIKGGTDPPVPAKNRGAKAKKSSTLER